MKWVKFHSMERIGNLVCMHNTCSPRWIEACLRFCLFLFLLSMSYFSTIPTIISKVTWCINVLHHDALLTIASSDRRKRLWIAKILTNMLHFHSHLILGSNTGWTTYPQRSYVRLPRSVKRAIQGDQEGAHFLSRTVVL